MNRQEFDKSSGVQASRAHIRRPFLAFVGALVLAVAVQGCLSRAETEGKVTDSSGSRGSFLGGAQGTRQGEIVPVEISARIEGIDGVRTASGSTSLSAGGFSGTPTGSAQPGELRFRESGELGRNRTLRISPVPGDLSAGVATAPSAHEDYGIEVTAVALNDDNVVLDIQVFNVDKTGKRVTISKPRLVVPYGEAGQIQELNASPSAKFSRLSVSVLPGQPRSPSPASSAPADPAAPESSPSSIDKGVTP